MTLTYFKRGKGQKLRRNRLQIVHKGQIKPKADWRAMDSPKNRKKKKICFFFFFTVRKNPKLEILYDLYVLFIIDFSLIFEPSPI